MGRSLDNFKDTILELIERVMTNTEKFARITKLSVEKKRIEYQIRESHEDIGMYVIASIESGAQSLSLSDEKITEAHSKISSLRKAIQDKDAEIENIKSSKDYPPKTNYNNEANEKV